jgi:hypothetical protein
VANINVINHHHNQGDYLAMTVDPNRPSTEALPTNDELQHKYDNPVIPPVEHRDDKNEKNGLGKKILAGVGALSVAAAGFFGVKAMGGEGGPAPAPEKTPAATAPVTPGQTPTAETSPSIAPSTTTEATPATQETNKTPEMVGNINVANLGPEAKAKAKLLNDADPSNDVWEVGMDEVKGSANPSRTFAELQFVVNSSMLSIGQDEATYKKFQSDSAGYAANEYGRYVYDTKFVPAYESSTTHFGLSPSEGTKETVQILAGRWVLLRNLKEIGTAGDGTVAPDYKQIFTFNDASFKTTKEGDGINAAFSNTYNYTIDEPVDMSKWVREVLGLPVDMGTPKTSTITKENTDVLARPDGAMLESNAVEN